MTTIMTRGCGRFVFLLSIIIVSGPATGKRTELTREDVPPPEIDSSGCQCVWSVWMNNDDYVASVGDNTTYKNLRRLYDFCEAPQDIKCREKYNWAIPFAILHTGGTVCDVTSGLLCVSRSYDWNSRLKPFYCDDYEITVQCCSCPTTTAVLTTIRPPETFEPAVMIANDEEYEEVTRKPTESITTTPVLMEPSSNGDLPLSVILIIIIGCIVIAGFMIIIWLILWKSGFHRKPQLPQQDFYQEAPLQNYTPITNRTEEIQKKGKVAFASSSGSIVSTSDAVTSTSDDEGYRSRPGYYQKRKTKGERDRKLNGSRGNAGDSLELTYPDLQLKNSIGESSDEGRFRKWFPDEYERSLQQKRPPASKSKMIFSSSINTSTKKTIPYMDACES